MVLNVIIFRLEATYCGAYPLCPNQLVYPEIYPQQCLYKNKDDLLSKLGIFCKNPQLTIENEEKIRLMEQILQYDANKIIKEFMKVIR